jgi:hypothetical protein
LGLKDEKKNGQFSDTQNKKQCGVKEEWEKRFTIFVCLIDVRVKKEKDGKRAVSVCFLFFRYITSRSFSWCAQEIFFFSWIVEEQTVTTHNIIWRKGERRGWMIHHRKIWNHYIISEWVRIHRNERNA